MISALLSMYGPSYPTVLVYMLQSCEYRAGPYLAWYWRTQDFSRVMHRRSLERTRPARLMLRALQTGMLIQIVCGLSLIALWEFAGLTAGWQFGLALLISYPIVWAHLVIVPLVLGRELNAKPKERRLVVHSEAIFKRHKGVKLAVAGSYGKTSMKELLMTVFSQGNKKVAATPANKNVSVSHARFAAELTGDEDIVIIEYGEGRPGDVERFARTTHPTHAVITGVAPAHLDRYKTLHAAGHDIFAVARYLKGRQVYVNADSGETKDFMNPGYQTYDHTGALGWKVSDIALTINGTAFNLVKGKRKLRVASGLLGEHQVGPLSLAVSLGLELGLTESQVLDGVSRTLPFEHRMQPYQLSGAWVIDDTYNGTIEGIRAGTELLAALPAQRKIYVTPGLVDQGKTSDAIHVTMGELITRAHPDIVILMYNSATPHIENGLRANGFDGELIIETDPLDFYSNLDKFVAVGDLVLMQNDWTDNYS